MTYLKLINCPLGHVIPRKSDRLDWAGVGLDPATISRDTVMGYDTVEEINYVQLLPITDEAKLLASGIVDAVNSNPNPDDSAAVVDQATFDTLSAAILAVRAAQ